MFRVRSFLPSEKEANFDKSGFEKNEYSENSRNEVIVAALDAA